ncbi:conserved Plasmodium protein, unknown function [Plasmodium ovale]|uniref:Uncharacterized protein n=2 Tax=Plasmodium ovale TaxID=36330 RepID=A0A1A8WK74_PLAOA|nr:conserved Plasmodium protein, unknown function [Plasmodium ovale curtisi]SCQ16462.1 conserved Plasmodium protein, unknown function [Plasmodium ovale]
MRGVFLNTVMFLKSLDGNVEHLLRITNMKRKHFRSPLTKMMYNTYKNKVFNSGIYSGVTPNYTHTNMHMNNPENSTNHISNPSNYKYDPSNNFYQTKYNNYNVPNMPNVHNVHNAQNMPNVQNEITNSSNTIYQYFSIFGSTAMCLIKPVYPDYIVNKNKVTIYGKGGFQFIFMKKQINSNKYDKNNKLCLFLKINTLSNILSIKDVEKIKTPIIIKGNNYSYLIIDKHKDKKDHVVIKYKYQPVIITDNFNDIDNLDIEMNEKNTNGKDSNDEKKNNFEELHVSSSFSEFMLFQKAANQLLPQLLGWARHH